MRELNEFDRLTLNWGNEGKVRMNYDEGGKYCTGGKGEE